MSNNSKAGLIRVDALAKRVALWGGALLTLGAILAYSIPLIGQAMPAITLIGGAEVFRRGYRRPSALASGTALMLCAQFTVFSLFGALFESVMLVLGAIEHQQGITESIDRLPLVRGGMYALAALAWVMAGASSLIALLNGRAPNDPA